MKTFNLIVKLVTALTAVAGAIYLIATYGDQIIAWAKKMLDAMPKCPVQDEAVEEEAVEEEASAAEEAAEEVPAEEVPAEEVPVEENAPVEEPVAAPADPVADEADFAE